MLILDLIWSSNYSKLLDDILGNIILYTSMAVEKLGDWQNWCFGHGSGSGNNYVIIQHFYLIGD